MSQDQSGLILNDLLGQTIDSKSSGNQNDIQASFPFPPNLTSEILAHLLTAASDTTPQMQAESVNRGSWSQEEDMALQNAINQLGENKWVEISKMIGTRSPKQARERWTNCLKPGLKKEPFETWEDEFILQKHSELGNKWAVIARGLPGRSAGAVKNRWYTNLKNAKSQINQMSQINPPMNSLASINPQIPSLNTQIGTTMNQINPLTSQINMGMGMDSITVPSAMSQQALGINSIVNDPLSLTLNDPTREFDPSISKSEE